MIKRLTQFAPVIALVLLLAYAGGVARLAIHTAGVPEFRQAAKSAIDALPLKIGAWEGQSRPIDARARDLLKPNAEAAILFQHARSKVHAYYSVIQVEDARDMTGHAPVNCYAGNGFELAPTEQRVMKLGEFAINTAVYRMHRDIPVKRGDQNTTAAQDWTVYNFFIFPDGSFGNTLLELDHAAEDYRKLKYGVAQVQVVTFDPRLGDTQRDEIFTTIAGTPQSLEMIRVLRSGLDWFGRRHMSDSLKAMSLWRKGFDR